MKSRSAWVVCAAFVGLFFFALHSAGGAPGSAGKVDAHGDDNSGFACTNASLNGSYGFYRHGTTGVGTATANSLAAIGLISFDGAGNIIAPGHQAISKNGVISDFNQPAGIGGTYQVDSDCTGEAFTPAGAPGFFFVVVDGGKGLYLLSLSPGNAVVAVATRVHPSDN